MPKYDVYYEKTVTLSTRIDAESPEEAYEKYKKMLFTGNADLCASSMPGSLIEDICDDDNVRIELSDKVWEFEVLEH